jgi:hypothetical protein
MDKARRRTQFSAVLADLERDISAIGVPDYVVFEVVGGKIKIVWYSLTTPPGVAYYDYSATARAEQYIKKSRKHRNILL